MLVVFAAIKLPLVRWQRTRRARLRCGETWSTTIELRSLKRVARYASLRVMVILAASVWSNSSSLVVRTAVEPLQQRQRRKDFIKLYFRNPTFVKESGKGGHNTETVC